MGVVIHWKPVENAAKLNLYQSTKRFGYPEIGLRGDITKTEMLSTDVSKEVMIPRNTVNYFCISGVDADGLELFGEVFSMGNFPNTGPGPDTLLRGTWEFGIFGEVSAEELMTNGQLGSLLIKAGATMDEISNGGKISYWNKCIVNGKIIFIPNVNVFGLPPSGDKPTLLAQRKLTMETGFPGAPILNKDGNDYRYRLPAMTKTQGAGQILSANVSATEEYLCTEAGMLMAIAMGGGKISRLAPAVNGGFNVWDDLNDSPLSTNGQIVLFATANYTSKTNNTQWLLVTAGVYDTGVPSYRNTNWFYNSSVSYGTAQVCPLLELVF